MGRRSDKIKVTVSFPSGSVTFDAPFWQTDETIIRDAINALPGFLAPRAADCKVERTQP